MPDASPYVMVALVTVALCVSAVGAYVVLLIGSLGFTGRVEVPSPYLYDTVFLDALGAIVLTGAASITAGVLVSLVHPFPGALAGGLVALLAAVPMARALERRAHLRRALPSPLEFWPCPLLRDHRPTGPLEDPVYLECRCGEMWGWTQPTLQGLIGVIYIANPDLEVGAPAPGGRVRTLEGRVGHDDLERTCRSIAA